MERKFGEIGYELVAAGASAQAMGAVGKKGDLLLKLIIVPETTAAGTVSIKDGGDTAINVFTTGTLADLTPIVIEIGLKSRTGAWQITTGTNVHVIAVGVFS